VVDDEKQWQRAGCYGCHRIYVLNKPHCNLHVVHQPVFCNRLWVHPLSESEFVPNRFRHFVWYVFGLVLVLVVFGDMSVQTVRVDKLDRANYASWSVKMRCLLVHYGLWHAVVSHAEGDEDDSASITTADHTQRACALIMLHVDDVYFSDISHLNCPREIWATLERVSQGSTYARKLRLRRDLHGASMSTGESVTAYIARIRRNVSHLRAVNVHISDDELVSAMLSGLPNSFSMVLTVIESSTVELTSDQIITQLLNAESRLDKASVTEAFAVPHVQKRFSAKPRQQQQQQQQPNRGVTSRIICHGCGERGHIRRFCPQHSKRVDNHGESQTTAMLATLDAF
jgi:hypothetical protein